MICILSSTLLTTSAIIHPLHEFQNTWEETPFSIGVPDLINNQQKAHSFASIINLPTRPSITNGSLSCELPKAVEAISAPRP